MMNREAAIKWMAEHPGVPLIEVDESRMWQYTDGVFNARGEEDAHYTDHKYNFGNGNYIRASNTLGGRTLELAEMFEELAAGRAVIKEVASGTFTYQVVGGELMCSGDTKPEPSPCYEIYLKRGVWRTS